MKTLYALLTILTLIFPYPITATNSLKLTHKEQQELLMQEERDKTRIKLATIGAVVVLGSIIALKQNGQLPDIGKIVAYLTGSLGK